MSWNEAPRAASFESQPEIELTESAPRNRSLTADSVTIEPPSSWSSQNRGNHAFGRGQSADDLESSAADDDRLAKMNARLKALGFTPPEGDRRAWERLAAVIEIDPAGLSFAEIYEQVLVWSERIILTERIRRNVGSTNAAEVEHPHAVRQPSASGFSFVGSRNWENWGLGLDEQHGWHLFHFNRNQGEWNRHRHVKLRIPAGIPNSLAQKFVSCRGTLQLMDAHALWKQHAQGMTSREDTIRALRAPLSRLRAAILEAIQSEGHSPDGMSIIWRRQEKLYRARIRFGYASRTEKSGIRFVFQY